MVATTALVPICTMRLKYLAKIRYITIDNWAFSLHYRFTMIVLLAFSILITASELFGDPIKCIRSGSDIEEKVINNFCWIEGTFTVPKYVTKLNYTDVAHPGVAQFVEEKQGDQVLEHVYYQWVCLVLFLQAVSFYVSRGLWKAWEKGNMKALMMDLNKCIIPHDQRKTKESDLVNTLHRRLGRYNAYAVRFLICEIINLANVIGQILLTDWFLGGGFGSYGWDVLKFPFDEYSPLIDPMSKVFPKMTKCTFHRYGSSGDVQRYDNLCLLPLNILNEKIYLFIWFWYIILSIVSGFAVFYRIVVMAFPQTRFYLLRGYNSLVPEDHFLTIINRCSYGDWFLLFLLSRNLDAMHYRDVVMLLCQKIESEPEHGVDVVDRGATSV